MQARERFVTRFDDSNDSNPAVTYVKHADVRPSSNHDLACCRLAQATVVVNVVELIRPSSPASVQARSLASEKPSWSARLDKLCIWRRAVPCRDVSLVVAVATLAAAAPTATVQLHRAATTVCKLNAGSAGGTGFKVGAALVRHRCAGNCLAVAIAESGPGLHRTARRTRPPTHRLAAAVDAADARVALPCHIALDQRPRTRGRLWNGTLMGWARCVVGS